MKFNRRLLLSSLTVAALSFAKIPAFAAQPVVEIIAFAHSPVHSALKPLREWLSVQSGKLRVVEINMESAEAEKRLQAIGLKGHLPIVILIDGKHKFTRKDGSAVEFVSFPNEQAAANATTTANNTWSTEDVQTAIKASGK